MTHFVSYLPSHPDWRVRTVIIEVPRDDAYIERMGNRITDFLYLFKAGRRPNDVGQRTSITVPKLF
jgi:hypothetical protein